MPAKGEEQRFWIESKDPTMKANFNLFVARHKSADGLSEGAAGFTNVKDAMACIKRWKAIEKE